MKNHDHKVQIMPNETPQSPLRSFHTKTFTQLLTQFGVSLAITTYQAGKLVIARVDGALTNTHFRTFKKPMGLAVRPDRIALGTEAQIHQFRNISSVAPKLEPAGRHDACYLPRLTQVTGDIDVHEMAWVGDEIWFINTRFSCLCTLDENYSFVPRWRPPFISAYDMRDRCHLNGLALRDGQPRYVTALGQSDDPTGWRRHKANGGILMDMDDNRILLTGLSMPHSPRWYRDRLWFLESGKGTLVYFDGEKGQVVTVAELPGFTRGLDFLGDYALIGLSQVRESAVFAGLPLTRTQPIRHCGVWVVEITSGRIVAFLHFKAGVQEIFAVCAVPWRFPEINPGQADLVQKTYVLSDAAVAEAVQPPANWETADQHCMQGKNLYNEGKLDEALTCFHKALALQPDYVPARFNLGILLGNLGRLDEAVAELQHVIEADAGHADALNILGYLEAQQGQRLQAMTHFERAIAITPNHAQAHYNFGLTLLKEGVFKQGFEELEWRWRIPELTPFSPSQPRWEGQPQPDKILLIHTGQDESDTFQMARFVSWAAARVKQVLLLSPSPMHALLRNVPGVTKVGDAAELAAHSFDLWTPMISLPLLYGLTPDTIPASIPYLTIPPRSGLTLPDHGTPRVGFCWAGHLTQGKDRLHSSRLVDWQPVLSMRDIQFFSLQKGEVAETQLADLPTGLRPIDLAPQIKDWRDTATLLSQLDLLIAVDSGVVHLAGALGRPVWTLVHRGADWRYPEQGETTAWYPSMRLFQQDQRGEWATALEKVAQELATWCSDKHE